MQTAENTQVAEAPVGEMSLAGTAIVGADVGGPVIAGQKRKHDLDGSFGGAEKRNKKNKKRKSGGGGPTLPKNALMQLNELYPGLNYQVVDQEGPVHCPTFTVEVEVNGQRFAGVACSKKKAKLHAAEKALASCVQLPNTGNGGQAGDGDFTADDLNGDSCMRDVSQADASGNVVPRQPRGKNPVMILNELRPGTQYVALSDVLTYNKTKVFSMEVTVDRQSFQGEGRNKKIAKARAAQAALKTLFNLEFKVPEGGETVPAVAAAMPSSGQSSAADISGSDVPALADHVARLVQQKFLYMTSAIQANYARRKVLAGVVMTTDVWDLSSAVVICVTSGTKCVSGEYMSVNGLVLNDCHAEILARRALRRFLFDQLHNLAEMKNNQQNVTLAAAEMSQKVTEVYWDMGMPSGVKSEHGKPSFDASIMHEASLKGKTMNDDATMCTPAESKVYCDVGMPSSAIKSETGEPSSEASINYEAILKGSVFEDNPDTEVGGYRLKPGVEFHLYVSTSPCGDARIFSPHETSDLDKHPNRKARGQLRTKIESGEGTIPITEDRIQTWDGIVQGGERLLTMSCSDKLARWNVVGLQGALLNYFVEPIYLASVILGSFYHNQHLARALCRRYGPLPDLPAHYVPHAPMLSAISNMEARNPGKASGYAVNWYLGAEAGLEIISTTHGKTEQERPSQLCKFEMFNLFSKLYGRLSTRNGLTCDPDTQIYSQVKSMQASYQKAKREFASALRLGGMGFWVSKPSELDEFTLAESVAAIQSLRSTKQQEQQQQQQSAFNNGSGDVAMVANPGNDVPSNANNDGAKPTVAIGAGDFIKQELC